MISYEIYQVNDSEESNSEFMMKRYGDKIVLSHSSFHCQHPQSLCHELKRKNTCIEDDTVLYNPMLGELKKYL